MPGLEDRRDNLERELAGLDAARAKVGAEKVDYVQRHRKRLTKDAEKHADQAARRYRQLVDELERARVDLSDARSKSLWAALFPNEPNLAQRSSSRLCRRPAQAADPRGPGRADRTEHVFDLLRVDVDWLEHARQFRAAPGTW